MKKLFALVLLVGFLSSCSDEMNEITPAQNELSDAQYTDGYNEGYDDGYDDGYDE